MAEPIGGKEHKWGWGNLLILAGLLELFATVLGWMALIFLPLFLAAEVFERFGRKVPALSFSGWRDLLNLQTFWVPFGKNVAFLAVIFVCFICFIFITASLLALIYSRMKPQFPGTGAEKRPVDNVSVPEVLKSKQANEPVSTVSTQVNATTEMERKKAEQERKKAEQERREKVEKARTEFKGKVAAFQDSLPKVFELNVAGGVVDFSEQFKATSLNVVMKEVSLRTYLVWDREAMTLKVSDSFAFFKEGKVRFSLELSDPAFAIDIELKDEVKPEPVEVVLEAKYPSAAKKFFEWKAKWTASVRLENAKQGQPADYDIRTLLGYDPEWVVWKSAEGLGSLTPDMEGHRIKGEPTVGSDQKLRLIFACRGGEDITHSVELLLTCNMDPELRWKEIERDQSDNMPVVAEEETFNLAKMANAVRSTGNSHEVRKPDDTFSKPNRVSRRQKSGDFDLAYASIRGRSHIRSGSFREDHVDAQFFLEGRAVAIVVSDGAGSAPLSRRGSSIVAAVGLKCLIELGQRLVNDPEALKVRTQSAVVGFAETVRAIRSQIEFEAECIKEHRPEFLAKEMYATFLGALVLPTEVGHVLLSYSAGDGAIGLGLAGDASGIKCAPDHGQSAGQTLFVLNKGADDAEKRLIFTPLPVSFALLLMSDGVSDPRIPQGEESKPETWNLLAGELRTLVREEPLNHDGERVEEYKSRGALCAWLDSYEKGHHDDRTIAVLFNKLT